jgi:hypothetical protein
MTAFDVDAWLNDYQPHTAEARICTRFDLLAQHSQLENELEAATKDNQRRALARKVVKLEAEIEASEKVFTFADIGGQWVDLIGKHPPTKEQLDADGSLDHNPETFPVAAIAASSTDPKLTVEQSERLRVKLQFIQWQKLWMATLEANLGMATAPKSLLAGAVLRLNGVSETTPALEESPAASS